MVKSQLIRLVDNRFKPLLQLCNSNDSILRQARINKAIRGLTHINKYRDELFANLGQSMLGTSNFGTEVTSRPSYWLRKFKVRQFHGK